MLQQLSLFDCEAAPVVKLHVPRDPKPIPDYDAPDLFEPDEPRLPAPPTIQAVSQADRVAELCCRFDAGEQLFGPLDRWTPPVKRTAPTEDDEDDDADLDGWVPWWCR
jgi:hypothetical protein